MSIYVVGSSKNLFLENDSIREKFIVDQPHEGDNIDNLNPWYCELTALYYLWKHPKSKYVGLEHYRRFFASPKHNKTRMTADEVEQILSDHDIITCKFRHRPGDCGYKWFYVDDRGDDLEVFIDILDEKCNGLGQQFKAYTQERELVQCNMFIAKQRLINDYCEWLFPKLALFDKYRGLGEGNRRIDGYLAEHIFGLWIRQAGLKNYTATKVEMRFLPVSGSKV